MAREEAPERQLEELLKCSICLGTYTHPRILQCSHIYCEGCIAKVKVHGQPGRRTFSCPLCRRDTPVPAGGARGLQSVDFLINNLKDIHDNFGHMKRASYCSVHSDKELELYCESCDELICFKCIYHGEGHDSHQYHTLRLDLETVSVKLSKMFQPEDEVQYATKFIRNFNSEVKGVQDEIASALEERVLKMTMLNEVAGRVEMISQRFEQQLDSPCPQTSFALGSGLQEATVKETCKVHLLVSSFRNKPCEEATTSVEGVLVSNLTGAKTTCGIKVVGQGQYLVSYYPTVVGRHELHLKVNGEHISGSPFSVTVKIPADDDTEMKGASGIAIGPTGEVVVSEEAGHCVSIVNGNGRRVWSFGSFGCGNRQFNAPCGLAVDQEGNILVADSKNHRVLKFTGKGDFLQQVGTKGNGPREFNSPRGIAINPVNDKVYIVDKNHRVQILNPDLTYAGKFGNHGLGPGKFSNPCGIACNSSGKVFVADIGGRIQVFTARGDFEREFDYIPARSAQGHVSIAIDSRDLVYHCAKGLILVFTPEGRALTFPSSCGQKARGIAVQGETLYLCYYDHVQVYKVPVTSNAPNHPSHLLYKSGILVIVLLLAFIILFFVSINYN